MLPALEAVPLPRLLVRRRSDDDRQKLSGRQSGSGSGRGRPSEKRRRRRSCGMTLLIERFVGVG